MNERNSVVAYLLKIYFDNSVENLAEATGYSSKQINSWISGETTPQSNSIDYIIHCIFTPEFKVIIEYGEFHNDQPTLTQLKSMLSGHENRAGIYAFYDAMANLLYVGKAKNILSECYSAIQRSVDVKFPAGIKDKPAKRSDVVKYISAYDVGNSDWMDYPKHVESLILRISKPRLNKVIGSLEKAYAKPDEF